MRSALRKMGNSCGLLIPKPFLAEIGADVGDDVKLTVEKGRLVVTPLKKRVREGWTPAVSPSMATTRLCGQSLAMKATKS